ncbi:unnamed protein product, partial [Effrenium voratum]
TRCTDFEDPAKGGDAAAQLAALRSVAEAAGESCAAVGECGLDYERLEFCPKELQLKYFEQQLRALALPLQKPLFLHCRTSAAAKDLVRLLEPLRAQLPVPPGVVHSFDGSLQDAQSLMDLGFFIGLNGCSLKTAENLEVVRQLPE